MIIKSKRDRHNATPTTPSTTTRRAERAKAFGVGHLRSEKESPSLMEPTRIDRPFTHSGSYSCRVRTTVGSCARAPEVWIISRYYIYIDHPPLKNDELWPFSFLPTLNAADLEHKSQPFLLSVECTIE
eukprot:scaffold1055_cov165-Amphora_coffeaeformis.AAC.19